MLSQCNFATIDKRLRQATGKMNSFFGGISIILTGDPAQLLPVGGTPLYNSIITNLMQAHGYECYKQFKVAIKLQVTVRQQTSNDPDQNHFIDFLGRLRNGDVNMNDFHLLCKRLVTPARLEEFKSDIRLFYDKESVKNHNKESLTELNMPIVPIIAKNSSKSGRNAEEDNFSGLSNDLFLAINSKIIMISNEWTEMGLVNGAPGIVRDIIYPRTMTNLFETHPIAVLIEFEKYNGPKFFEDEIRKNWIPINAKTVYNKILNSTRIQFPIRLTYATTIHKSQGSTLDRGVVDLGPSEKSLGLSFVALSRFKNINDFIIKPFPFKRLEKIKQSKSLAPRLQEEKRIQSLVDLTFSNFAFLLPN